METAVIAAPDLDQLLAAYSGGRISRRELDANDQLVEIGVTEEFAEFTEMLALNPALRTRNRGEMAAAEVLAKELDSGIDCGLLLIPDAELILDRATAIRGATARGANAPASRGAEDALDAWLD